jgi:glycosyltransferase involved in cell wall biosynthesis
MSKRVLFISYPFPPVGGAGVQRVCKFVKYLPHFNWEPSVLTVANPSVPALDSSLAKDIPAGTILRRARTFEPCYGVKAAVSAANGTGNGRGRATMRIAKSMARRFIMLLLQPDPQILWVPRAVQEGRRLLREITHDAIVVTGPPFSAFLIGATLSREFDLPLVLDYRDEWTILNAYLENKRLDPLSARLQRNMQRRIVRRANALVATTASSAAALKTIRADARSDATISWIYNGFDPEDFAGIGPSTGQGGERYRLAYVGTLWNLTSIAPLVDAIEHLERRCPDLADRLELVVAGRRTDAQQRVLDRLGGSRCRLVQHPYLDHLGAVELIRSADGLCVLLSDVPSAERVVPAKLFEYMACRASIFSIAPPGEVWTLLKDYPRAHTLHPRNPERIAEVLAEQIRLTSQLRARPSESFDMSLYNRRDQSRQLASLLDSLQ